MDNSRIKILNFHGVGMIPRHIDESEIPFWISVDFFQKILDLIIQESSRFKVEITFDDGNRSDVDICLPLLQERSLLATFFVLSGRLKTVDYLSKADLKTLVGKGMLVGNHGCNHVDWRSLNKDELHHEVVHARQSIETDCGRSIDAAAIPFGVYNGRVLRSLKLAGYRSIYTSDGGVTHDYEQIKGRSSIRNDMTLHDVENLIRHNEPWDKSIRRAASILIKQYL